MTEYLISFNAEWVGEHTEEELRAKTLALRPLVAEHGQQLRAGSADAQAVHGFDGIGALAIVR